MNSAESNKPVVQGGMPTWSEREQFFKVQRWFRVLIAAVVLLWLLLIGWVLFIAPIKNAEASKLEAGANLTLVLAPVLVAAAAVERTLESVFNVIEGSWHKMVAYLGRGLRWLKSAEVEVKQARQFLAEASDKYNMEMQSLQSWVSSLRQSVNCKCLRCWVLLQSPRGSTCLSLAWSSAADRIQYTHWLVFCSKARIRWTAPRATLIGWLRRLRQKPQPCLPPLRVSPSSLRLLRLRPPTKVLTSNSVNTEKVRLSFCMGAGHFFDCSSEMIYLLIESLIELVFGVGEAILKANLFSSLQANRARHRLWEASVELLVN